MSWLERSSAMICTLPRIMPRSASETRASPAVEASGSGWALRARVTPGRTRLAPARIPPLRELLGVGAAVVRLVAFSSSRLAATNSSRAVLMSAALAYLMG